jgi:hypothetical protein
VASARGLTIFHPQRIVRGQISHLYSWLPAAGINKEHLVYHAERRYRVEKHVLFFFVNHIFFRAYHVWRKTLSSRFETGSPARKRGICRRPTTPSTITRFLLVGPNRSRSKSLIGRCTDDSRRISGKLRADFRRRSLEGSNGKILMSFRHFLLV